MSAESISTVGKSELVLDTGKNDGKGFDMSSFAKWAIILGVGAFALYWVYNKYLKAPINANYNQMKQGSDGMQMDPRMMGQMPMDPRMMGQMPMDPRMLPPSVFVPDQMDASHVDQQNMPPHLMYPSGHPSDPQGRGMPQMSGSGTGMSSDDFGSQPPMLDDTRSMGSAKSK